MGEVRVTQHYVEVLAEANIVGQVSNTAQSASVQHFLDVSVGHKIRVRAQVSDASGTVIIPRDCAALNVLEITDSGTSVGTGGGGVNRWLDLIDTPSQYQAGHVTHGNLAGNGIDFIPGGAEGQVLTIVDNNPAWAANAGTGVTTFLQLDDTDPTTYTGHAGKFVQVNDVPDGLEFHTLLAFERVKVSGESDVVALAFDDDLTFAEGLAITLATTPATRTVTIAVDPSQIDLDDLGTRTFLQLTDTPSTYTGQEDRILTVNTAPDAVEFKAVRLYDTGSSMWAIAPIATTHGVEVQFNVATVNRTFRVRNLGSGGAIAQVETGITVDAWTTAGVTTNAATGVLSPLSASQGSVIYYGASGVPAALGPGSSGHFLQTQGAGANPVWAASSGGLGDAYTQINTYADGENVQASGSAAVTFDSADTSIEITTSGDDPDVVNFALCNLPVPSDGTYNDGLFQWTSLAPYKVADAIDDLNEVLANLAPSPAPALTEITITSDGADGYLTWDGSNPLSTYAPAQGLSGQPATLIDQEFVDTGARGGVFLDSGSVQGEINPSVAATLNYGDDAWGHGDEGTLELWLNGAMIHSVNLVSFASGNSTNAATSGFQNISAVKTVTFDNGSPFVLFKYRNGLTGGAARWIVHSNEATWTNGYNYVRVVHNLSVDENSNYCDWVVDPATGSVNTNYAAVSLSGLVMSGSQFLTGVQYHTSGTALYTVAAQFTYHNTYQGDANAVIFTESNGSIPNQTMPSCLSGAPPHQNAQLLTYTNLTFTVSPSSGGRILDAAISTTCTVPRTFVANQITSASSSIPGLLVDQNISVASTQDDNTEPFRAEGYRLKSDLDIDDIDYGSGPGNGPAASTWSSTVQLTGAGYLNGLLVYNDGLHYPKGPNVANLGDFRNAAAGGPVENGPAGNPNYSGATGNRVYLRYFYSAVPTSNFNFAFTNVTSTTFVAVGTALTGNNVYAEILAPSQTTDEIGATEWKDMVTAATSNDAVGAFASTYGPTIPSNWGVTIGTKSTANSGNAIVLRITSGASWAGSIGNIEVDFSP